MTHPDNVGNRESAVDVAAQAIDNLTNHLTETDADWLEAVARAATRAVAEHLTDAIRKEGRRDIEWHREHKQNHEDVVRIVGATDAYENAIRTIETEVGL